MIYVDKLGHMVSDKSLEELHSFAKSIGIKRIWFQPKHNHYDLTTKHKITQAVSKGAVLADPRKILMISKEAAE